jgi:hypothetical protein
VLSTPEVNPDVLALFSAPFVGMVVCPRQMTSTSILRNSCPPDAGRHFFSGRYLS